MAESLKRYLEGEIGYDKAELDARMMNLERESRFARLINPRHAMYDVLIIPLKRDAGIKGTHSETGGSLRAAILNAERAFSEDFPEEDLTNVEYQVGIELGGNTRRVPERYWQRHTFSRRKRAEKLKMMYGI